MLIRMHEGNPSIQLGKLLEMEMFKTKQKCCFSSLQNPGLAYSIAF